MKRPPLRGALVAAIVAISLSSNVVAQRIGQGPQPAAVPPGNDDGAVARKVMDRFSACIFKSKRVKTLEALAIPDTRESNRRLVRLVKADCLYDGELRFDRRLFRGALFTHAYQAEFDQPLADLPAKPSIRYSESGDAIYDFSMPFADCVVRADPASAHALVSSDVATDAERKAFSALSPALDMCLAQGSQISFSKTSLRGFIAESLYRLSNASQRQEPAE